MNIIQIINTNAAVLPVEASSRDIPPNSVHNRLVMFVWPTSRTAWIACPEL